MLAVGILAYLMMTFTGYYYIEGPSYAALQDILHGDIAVPAFFLLLFAAKLLATGPHARLGRQRRRVLGLARASARRSAAPSARPA